MLSVIEQAALDEVRLERDYWKEWVWNTVRATPTITEGDLRVSLDSQPDPYPNNKFGIKDRQGLLDEYIVNVEGYPNVVRMMLAYPIEILLHVAPELGKPLPSIGEVTLWGMVGQLMWGISSGGGQIISVRDPAKGNMVVQEYCELNGTRVERNATVELIDGGYVTTWSDWQVM